MLKWPDSLVLVHPDLDDGRGAFACAGATTTDETGVEVRRFTKELIRVGDYVDSADNEWSVTGETLDHWAETFARMKTNGVDVPIPNSHDAGDSPDDNRGYVREMWRDGDSLMMACDMIGEDGIAAAARSDVSLMSPASLKDGKGHVYKRPIEHVALTIQPVVPGLKGFVTLAAARRVNGSNETMDLKKLGKALGIKALTDDNAHEQITAAFSALKKTGETDALELKAARLTIAEKPKTKPEADVSPQLLELARDARLGRLKSMIASGGFTPATRDKFIDIFVGEKDKSLRMELARGETNTTFNAVMDALEDNHPIEMREKTRAQARFALTDPTDRENGSPLVRDAHKRMEMAKA